MESSPKKPWHEIGVDVDAKLSSSEMLYKAGLDWEVSKIPSQRPKSYGNQETIRFFKAFFEAGEANIEAVGSLDDARILWSLARLHEDFTLKSDDEVKGYILLASRNESREKIEIQFTTLRTSCYNTFQVVSKARSHMKNDFRRTFKPTFPFLNQKVQKFDDEKKKKVKAITIQGREAISAFGTIAKSLTYKKVDKLIARQYLLEVFQSETNKVLSPREEKSLRERAENKVNLAFQAYFQAPGQESESTNGTAWGLLNAVTYTIDHQLGTNHDSRLRQAWFGTNAKIKNRAFDLALSL